MCFCGPTHRRIQLCLGNLSFCQQLSGILLVSVVRQAPGCTIRRFPAGSVRFGQLFCRLCLRHAIEHLTLGDALALVRLRNIRFLIRLLRDLQRPAGCLPVLFALPLHCVRFRFPVPAFNFCRIHHKVVKLPLLLCADAPSLFALGGIVPGQRLRLFGRLPGVPVRIRSLFRVDGLCEALVIPVRKHLFGRLGVGDQLDALGGAAHDAAGGRAP